MTVPESVFAYKRSLEEKAIILIQNYNRDIDLKAHSMTLKPYEFVAVIV
ncbi:hypothetical protein [Butyrivibrio fibrisolvens]|nr:hypothetical protein [Butyrivibrio fibrisolvens]